MAFDAIVTQPVTTHAVVEAATVAGAHPVAAGLALLPCRPR